MTEYRYRAYDAEGRHYEDTVEANTIYELTQTLVAQGLTVSSIEKVARKTVFPGYRRLRWEDLRLFTEQLEAILRSGYPLVPALAALAADLHKPGLRAATDQLRSDLERGLSLEEAFRLQEHRFPPAYSALMRAGEITGNLPGVLTLMTDHAARMAGVKNRVLLAAAYPIVLIVAASVIILYQLLYVVPVFGDIFGELGGKLPAPTLFLLHLSRMLTAYWPIALGALPAAAMAIVGSWIALRRSSRGRQWIDGVLLRVPGLGMTYHGLVQARFCRTLSLLLGGRVPMLDALNLAGAASGSARLAHVTEVAAKEVLQGRRLVDGLHQDRFFSPSFYWLLGTAEERGQVVEALNDLADSAERSVQAREQMLGSFITPVMTVIIAGIVGFIVVSLYLPIFTLGDQVIGN
jgi:type IV pilus assembly protein PilC